jgi:hypothetical protein
MSGSQYAAQTLEIVNDTLAGIYSITAVGVSKNGEIGKAFDFTFIGLEWTTLATGTYYFFNSSRIGISSNPTTLQVCTTDDKLYRFKDVFAAGYSLKINLLELTGNDSQGTYTFFRVPVTATPFTYGSYGAVSVRDIGYWQNDDTWITEAGYESGMYADYYCFILVQYFVSGGSLGYDYDEFVPD